ncbi:MAG: sigma-70 family RNA polymerase sigma factor [Saprospiraceae bacterium]|nr:sigma-70 family RNA polymerase sigma factor [Saprospiraceae bacterium]
MEKYQLEDWVRKAKEGDRKALEQIVLRIKDQVYHLSLKMLLYPEEAKDATQDILIKIITHLGTFRGDSQFTTWVYRVATNMLLSRRGKKTQTLQLSFEEYAELIDRGQSEQVHYTQNEGELSLLEEEVKMSCTQGLLLCLGEKARLVYILGELLELTSQQGAEILSISPQNFRKILSRARSKIRGFLQQKCGLVRESNACRCKKKIDYLITDRIIDPKQLRFAPYSHRSIDLVNQLATLEKTVAVYRAPPSQLAPQDLLEKIKETLSLVQ